MTTQLRETIFTFTWPYVAYSLLLYVAVAGWLLMPFLVDFGPGFGWVAGVVLVAEMLGLVLLIWPLAKCGIFVVAAGVELRTVTRTTVIPFSRLRIYENRVSFAAKADMVPVLADTNGRTVKAGVLTGMDPTVRLGIVRTILHIRETTISDTAVAEAD